MTKSKKRDKGVVLRFSEHERKRVDEFESDLDALFRLPLAEFTGARNALAAQLKKSGRGDEAARVKTLAKPSVSAWAVNQLYWNHREAFDRLVAAGERFHKAQTSRSGAKAADMREALEARREAITQLSELATALLRDAGQNPSLDTIRRITTTLEGVSAYAQLSDGPRPGRLTHDVDPPGFESLASFVPAAGMRSVQPAVAGGSTSKKKQTDPPATAGGTDLKTTNARRKGAAGDNVRVAAAHKAKIAAAKVSLQKAKSSLTKAQARAQSLAAAQKKADAEAKKAEKHRRDVEASLEKAKAASEDAARRARHVADEVEESTKSVKDAEGAVEAMSKELESLLRKS